MGDAERRAWGVGVRGPIYAVDGVALQPIAHHEAYLALAQTLDVADEGGFDVARGARGGGVFHNREGVSSSDFKFSKFPQQKQKKLIV